MSRPDIRRMSSAEVHDNRTTQQREAELALMDAIQTAQLLRKAEEQTKQANMAFRALQEQQDAIADALALHTVEMSDGEFEEAMRELEEGRGKIKLLPRRPARTRRRLQRRPRHGPRHGRTQRRPRPRHGPRHGRTQRHGKRKQVKTRKHRK
jgi:acyl-CoA reductase-like NAD-dependent aldehyde dehydrogenase